MDSSKPRGMRGGPREGFGGAQPGAGRKPDAEPKKPRAVRLSDRQAAAFQSLGGVGWLQGQCNLEIQRLSAATPPAVAHAWPALITDIPNEAWLQKQVDRSKSKGRNAFGAPYMGSVTGRFKGVVQVDVKTLARLNGLNGEQKNARPASLEWLKNELSKNALKNVGEPYIEVGYDGVPWVSEGNHRIMAAQALGWKSMPVEIRYFDGGERVAGVLSPTN